MTTFLEGPAVPGSLKQMNRLTVLQILRQAGPITKPALAHDTGISRPTISKLIDELVENGLAECVGLTSPTSVGGKPGALYRFNANGVYCGAIFLTFDTAHIAIVNGNGEIQGLTVCPLGIDRRPEPVMDLLSSTFQNLLASLHLTTQHLLGVGVGVPGLTSFHTGTVHFAPHLPEWQDVPVRAMLKTRLGSEVWVDNDCHVQALAERHFGEGQTCTDFVMVESGIGISAAFYLQGTLYRGSGETAGEVGHMTIQEDGPMCNCGNQGCWETLASTTHMVQEAYQLRHINTEALDWLTLPTISDEPDVAIKKLEPHIINEIARNIFQAANNGQAEAITLVTQHATHFGIGLANIINTLNPQRIMIWGDSLAGGDLFLETVRTTLLQRALLRPRQMCDVVFSSLTQNVGVLGAASLVIDALFTSYTHERIAH